MQEQQASAEATETTSEPKLILVFDAETTGIPEYKLPSEDPCQPHLTEIAALLYTDRGELVEAFTALIKPDGWVIPEEVVALNGITNELAKMAGVSEADAVTSFMNMHNLASLRVSHNISFDDRIMRIGLKRYMGDEIADAYKAGPKECTALLAKPLCQLPPTEAMKKTNFKNSFKTPNLAEALAHFTGDVGKDQHRALSDATDCARVYFALKGVRMPDYPNDLKVLTDAEEAERVPVFIGTDSEGGGHD